MSIGLLNEGHLHASLRARYLQPGDETEARVDGYIVDIHRPGLIVEVQTANFSSIARKMRDLATRHRVRLVYPVAKDRWIVKMPQRRGDLPTRRKSPKHFGVMDVFSELVSFPDLIASENFELDVVLIGEEAVWRFDRRRNWRRRGWVLVERRLLEVYDTVQLHDTGDFLSMLPPALPDEFLTSDLAASLPCRRHVAQQMAYCLRHAGLIEAIGRGAGGVIYARAGQTTKRAS